MLDRRRGRIGSFLVVFWQAELPMQALLQIYYVGVAVHGWIYWGAPDTESERAICRLSPRGYALCTAGIAAATAVTLVLRGEAADLTSGLDALTSWGGVLATWLVARKVLDAWLWWIAIDAATIALYLQVELLASSALYALYTVLAYLGWRTWRKHFQEQRSTPGTASP